MIRLILAVGESDEESDESDVEPEPEPEPELREGVPPTTRRP